MKLYELTLNLMLLLLHVTNIIVSKVSGGEGAVTEGEVLITELTEQFLKLMLFLKVTELTIELTEQLLKLT